MVVTVGKGASVVGMEIENLFRLGEGCWNVSSDEVPGLTIA